MHPTFTDPQFLIVEPVRKEDIQVGDIIIFKVDYSDKLIIHRIIAMRNGTYITRGDNCADIDPKPVRFDDIQGRATGIVGKSADRTVRNGAVGLGWARYLYLRAKIRRHVISPMFQHSISRKIREWIRFRAMIRPAYVRFRQPDGSDCIQVIWSKRCIGLYHLTNKTLNIRRPYSLLISSSSARLRINKILTDSNSSNE